VIREFRIVEAIQGQQRAIPPTTIRTWVGQWNVHGNVLLFEGMSQLGIDGEVAAVPSRLACVTAAGALSYLLLLRHCFPVGIPPDPGMFHGQFFPALQASLGRLSPALGLFRVL
jgi:hypothetical protein